MAHLSSAEEARRWFAQARADLRDAEYLLERDRFDSGTFHAHQAAEKALNAFLYSRGELPGHGHSVRKLGQRTRAHVPSLGPLTERAQGLDVHYIPSRYPNGLPADAPVEVYTREVAEPLVALAREVLDAVEKLLTPAP